MKINYSDKKLREADFKELEEKTIIDFHYEDHELLIKTKDDKIYIMKHDRDCCESVYLDTTHSLPEIKSILNEKILVARKDSIVMDREVEYTFYSIRTDRGGNCQLRWIGESNGYYATDVDFYEAVEKEEYNNKE